MDPRLILAKRRLIARVFELRRNDFRYESLDKPQSVQDDVIQTDSGPKKRRRIILTAHGCSVATCSMCPLPDEAVDPMVHVDIDHWMNQIKRAIGLEDDIHTLTIYHNGNYFCDSEVPATWRNLIHSYLAATKIKELVVESLPQYLTEERLAAARAGLKQVKLVVAIGLQSSNDIVREVCMTSTCAANTFSSAVARLKAQGDDAQAFLLFHPPFLTIEESIYDIRESIRFVAQTGVVPTICPMKVAPNTVVADLAARGLYQAPDLWYLYYALHGMSARPRVRVAASLLNPAKSASSSDWTPHDWLLHAFSRLNETGDLRDTPIHTRMDRPWPYDVAEPNPETILTRINRYLDEVHQLIKSPVDVIT